MIFGRETFLFLEQSLRTLKLWEQKEKYSSILQPLQPLILFLLRIIIDFYIEPPFSIKFEELDSQGFPIICFG
jgi:hypothetical protein